MTRKEDKDLRWQRTQLNLEKALLTLLKKKPLHKVQIKELTELAMVSRQAFYLHYDVVEELFDDCVSRIILEIEDNLTSIDKYRAGILDREMLIDSLKVYHNHFDELKVLMRVADQDLLMRSFFRSWQRGREASPNLVDISADNDLVHNFSMYYTAGGFYVVLRQWVLYNDKVSPEDMADTFIRVMQVHKPV